MQNALYLDGDLVAARRGASLLGCTTGITLGVAFAGADDAAVRSITSPLRLRA